MVSKGAESFVVFFCSLALAVVATWPVAPNITSRIPGDEGDPVLNTWILWWNAHAIPLTDRWWDAPFLFPIRRAMALSEHLLGISAITTPLQLAGVGALTAYNVSLLLSFALSGFLAFLLVRHLTGSSPAAWCGGLAFAMAPYRAGQLGHLQVLTAQWMPLMLLGLHLYISSPDRETEGQAGQHRRKVRPVSGLFIFGGAWLLQAASNGYFMLFLPALVVPWILWFVPWRRDARAGVAILAAWAIASLPLLPILLEYREVHQSHGFARALDDIRQFSATPASFLKASPLLSLWPYGQPSAREDFLFPGMTPILLVAAGAILMFRRLEIEPSFKLRSAFLFYMAVTLLLWALALGPGGPPGGSPDLWRPYSWLLWLPGFEALRVPSRFAAIATLTFAVASAISLALIQEVTGRWRSLTIAAVIAGITIDGLMVPLPLLVPPARIILPDADAAVVEIPPHDPMVSAAAMYRQMSHQQPLVNGYTGHTTAHYAILSFSLARGDTSVLTALARRKPLLIIVNERKDPGGDFRKLIEEMPAVRPEGLTAAGPMFRLPLQPPIETPAEGTQLKATLTETGSRRLQVQLDGMHRVNAIRFDLLNRFRDLPERILIESSDDGRMWRESWLGWTGEYALEGALVDPRRVPVTIPLRGVTTRYLRIYPAPAWLATELMVLGDQVVVRGP